MKNDNGIPDGPCECGGMYLFKSHRKIDNDHRQVTYLCLECGQVLRIIHPIKTREINIPTRYWNDLS